MGGGRRFWIKYIFSRNTYRNICTPGILTGIYTPGIPSGIYILLEYLQEYIYSWNNNRLQENILLEYLQEYIYSWNTFRNIYIPVIPTGIYTPRIPTGIYTLGTFQEYIYSWNIYRNIYTSGISTGIYLLLEYQQEYKLLEYLLEYILLEYLQEYVNSCNTYKHNLQVRILQVSASALNQSINLKEGGNSKVSKNSKKICEEKKKI